MNPIVRCATCSNPIPTCRSGADCQYLPNCANWHIESNTFQVIYIGPIPFIGIDVDVGPLPTPIYKSVPVVSIDLWGSVRLTRRKPRGIRYVWKEKI